MINNPPVNDLQDKVGTRYMLVTVVAKRARQLVTQPERIGNEKPVSIAVNELFNDKLTLNYPEEYTK